MLLFTRGLTGVFRQADETFSTHSTHTRRYSIIIPNAEFHTYFGVSFAEGVRSITVTTCLFECINIWIYFLDSTSKGKQNYTYDMGLVSQQVIFVGLMVGSRIVPQELQTRLKLKPPEHFLMCYLQEITLS
jgi:hypothetical protein